MIKNTCWWEDKPGQLQCGPFTSTSISGGHRSPRISEAGSALMHISRIGIHQQIATLIFNTIGHYSILLATIYNFCNFFNFGDQKVNVLGHPMLLGYSSYISHAMIIAKYR